jgi:hypothetical protein
MVNESRPVLNPILAFKRDPRRAGVTGRAPSEDQIRFERLDIQRVILSKQVRELRTSGLPAYGNCVLVTIKMFDDSLAPTYEPESIFREGLGSPLVAPIDNGYLAQIDIDSIDGIANLISGSNKVDVRVTVSRIASISPVSSADIIGASDEAWESAIVGESGRIFSAWLAPYAKNQSREHVVKELLRLQSQGVISTINDAVGITREQGSDADQLQLQEGEIDGSLLRAARDYRQRAYVKVNLAFANIIALQKIVASGTIFKIEPVRPLVAAEIPAAPDPERPIPSEQWQPVVGIVDGGLFAKSYEPMVAWRAPSLVSDVIANRTHGNRVTSLVVHGGAWNTHLNIPELTCRVGVAQAIARNGHGSTSRVSFESYLRSVISRHHGSTKVWNFSFNEPVSGGERLEMSLLGHEIHKIAREFNILPVISIGNVDQDNNQRLGPPADCEAALTVGGRVADGENPGPACQDCLPGPGPEGLKKPEVSWFSTLRGIGGAAETGSSYAAAITSALAAHTFHNLKNPTPDLVRALLINTSDRDNFDNKLGWGSPCIRSTLPWECEDGSVTLVWSSKLRAGQWYYWEDIPIPPEIIHDDKLKGRVSLTAVLNPMVSELGSANYFSTRLQVALQYTKVNGKMGNLAGTMREDIEREQVARSEHAKWNPIRHHIKDISRGIGFSGNGLRVCARIFGRDLYQHGLNSNSEIKESDVAFALTLAAPVSGDGASSIYNSVATRLGTYVESAVNDIDVHVSR